MIQGTYYKEWSTVLGREMEFKVYGHAGVPVLALPARGGRFYDWENNGMPDAIAQLLNEGKVQLFCADAMDGEGLLNGDLPQRCLLYTSSLCTGGRSARLDRPNTRKKVSVVRKLTGRPGRSRRPASSMSPFSSRPDTLEEESTPRTCSIKAVSYTHLDVYKRQHLPVPARHATHRYGW